LLRPLKNEWGATLAGDLAQTALLKRRSQTYIGPDGWFNTSLCARGRILTFKEKTSFKVIKNLKDLKNKIHKTYFEMRRKMADRSNLLIRFYFEKLSIRIQIQRVIKFIILVKQIVVTKVIKPKRLKYEMPLTLILFPPDRHLNNTRD
jgi:hypothetical protein